MFLLHCPKKSGTVQHFRPSRCRKRCAVPMFLGPGMQKHCTVPIFELETLKRLFFFFEFFGTVRCFCFTVPKRLVQYSTSGPPGAENAVLSQSFWVQSCKNAVITVPIFELETLKRLVFLSFLGQYGVFASLSQKIGTVQHFRPSRCTNGTPIKSVNP